MADQAEAPRPIRVLVVDSSTSNRRNIVGVFADRPDVEVVGEAGGGEAGLKLATTLKPDIIVLDLMEVPRVEGVTVVHREAGSPAFDPALARMDGLTFLRVLMSTTPSSRRWPTEKR